MRFLVLIITFLYPLERYRSTVLSIDNLDFTLGGQIKIQVYDKRFLQDDDVEAVLEKNCEGFWKLLAHNTGRVACGGEYMIAIFHDGNTNGKMDYSFFCRPKEGYSFSGAFSCKTKSRGPALHYVKFSEGFQHVNVHLCY